MKYAFHGLISILERTKERTSELKEMVIETSQMKHGEKKQTGHKKEHPRTVGPIENSKICIIAILEREERQKRAKEIFEEMIPKISQNS